MDDHWIGAMVIVVGGCLVIAAGPLSVADRIPVLPSTPVLMLLGGALLLLGAGVLLWSLVRE